MKQSDYLNENSAILNSLKKLPLLGSLEERHVKGLVKLCRVTQYEPGEVIFKEGDFDQFIYFLLSGKVKVIKGGTDVTSLGRTGDIFGEMCLIDATPRSATVAAVEPTNCLKMDVFYIKRLPEEERNSSLYIIYRVFCEILSNRLRLTTEELSLAKDELARLKKDKV
ncbi:MAG: cyclic nucleotide-binding domain-containing protein [Deltaproteobacteria bacterium]|nr:cyclic nucleotide-binding domain-containing protein [Deltaproteobacteria bacterium]